MHRVLLVEDSEECQVVVRRALASPDIKLSVAKTLGEAKQCLRQVHSNPIELILLDIGLPDGDGLSLLDYFGSHDFFQDVPVFLLTGKTDLVSKVTAFGWGAEDYLVKPVDPIELKARVEMRLRKLSAKKRDTDHLKKGRLTLDTALMRASVQKNGKNEILDLTTKEFKILAFLMQNENSVYPRSALIKAIWGTSVHVLDRTVDSHVCGLRKKLGELSNYVECVPSAGYRFCVASPTTPDSSSPVDQRQIEAEGRN